MGVRTFLGVGLRHPGLLLNLGNALCTFQRPRLVSGSARGRRIHKGQGGGLLPKPQLAVIERQVRGWEEEGVGRLSRGSCLS